MTYVLTEYLPVKYKIFPILITNPVDQEEASNESHARIKLYQLIKKLLKKIAIHHSVSKKVNKIRSNNFVFGYSPR